MRSTATLLGLIGALSFASLAPTAAGAATNLVSNGSFEASADDPGSFETLANGSTDITDWKVTKDDVDYIGTYWQAADGNRSLDLSGFQNNGEVDQTIQTVVGQHYLLGFWLSANPDDAEPNPRYGTAYIDGVGTTISYALNGNSRPDMKWAQESIDFIATSTSTTIGFGGIPNTNGSYGLALDKVSVTAVPEPAAWALMLTGFFGMGAMIRRRRNATAAAAA